MVDAEFLREGGSRFVYVNGTPRAALVTYLHAGGWVIGGIEVSPASSRVVPTRRWYPSNTASLRKIRFPLGSTTASR